MNKESERLKIENWMNEHKDFINSMNQIASDILKGSWDKDKFDVELVKQMLKEKNLKINFDLIKMLKIWKNS